MKNSLETRLGIFVALAVIAAVLILEVVGGMDLFRKGVRYTTEFDDVQDLKVGDRVKMAGREIGRVESIDLDLERSKVKITMKVSITNSVHTDSVARIKSAGLMGQNFVAIDFGKATSPVLGQDQNIASTNDTPDINAMFAKLSSVADGMGNVTKSFSGDKIDNLLGPLNSLLTDTHSSIVASMANIELITKQISEGKGSVGKLIYDNNNLYNTTLATISNLQDTATEIKTTFADARKVVDGVNQTVTQINSGHGTVGKLLTDDTLYRETTTTMTNLKEILQKVNQGQGTVGKIINDRELYNDARLTLKKLDSATESLEDQGPLSVMGILFNKLF